MHFGLKNNCDQLKTIVKLAIFSAVFAFGCTLLGYLFLPFAAAYYAAVLVYERGGRRIASYVVPIVMFTLNLILRGLYSLEAVAYVAVALIMYFCITRGASNAETSFYLSACIAVMILISAVLLAFEMTQITELVSVKQFYQGIYENYKDYFVQNVSKLLNSTNEGELFLLYNSYEVELLFVTLAVSLVSVFLIASFALSGVTVKCFKRIIRRYSADECGILEWKFRTSGLVAYFYIAISLLSIFSNSGIGTYSYTLMVLNSVFSAVYLYLGLKFFIGFFLSRGRSRFFALVMCVIAFVLLSGYSVQAFSYLGVVCNLVANRSDKKKALK